MIGLVEFYNLKFKAAIINFWPLEGSRANCKHNFYILKPRKYGKHLANNSISQTESNINVNLSFISGQVPYFSSA